MTSLGVYGRLVYLNRGVAIHRPTVSTSVFHAASSSRARTINNNITANANNTNPYQHQINRSVIEALAWQIVYQRRAHLYPSVV
jgi:hypothetical protein